MVPVMVPTGLDYLSQSPVRHQKRVIHASSKAMHSGDGGKGDNHGDKRIFSSSLRGIVSEQEPNAIE
jgi:hypothetical protein